MFFYADQLFLVRIIFIVSKEKSGQQTLVKFNIIYFQTKGACSVLVLPVDLCTNQLFVYLLEEFIIE